jgi:hypothetical protein
MRIVSKFKDYYDVGQGLGYDPSIVYVREEKEIIFDKKYHRYNPSRGIIGFCGKLYPFVEYHFREKEKEKKVFFYSLDDVNKFVEQTFSDKEKENYNKKDRSFYSISKYKSYNINYHLSWTFDRMEYAFALTKDLGKLEYFAKYNTPIFIAPDHSKLIINGLLRPWEFYKAVDPYTAYQEISMFVGGVLLAPTNPIPDIDDETMRDVKGFDKWSFRKEPKK